VFAFALTLCATGVWADSYSRGNDYYRKGEYDRAIADYTKAIKLDPKHAFFYNNRGIAYGKKGDRKQAIADYRKALEIDPSYQRAKNNLKRLGVTP
jgi:tetratricopeptide (TPR) repeat protein